MEVIGIICYVIVINFSLYMLGICCSHKRKQQCKLKSFKINKLSKCNNFFLKLQDIASSCDEASNAFVYMLNMFDRNNS